jgi:hypothetical protein
MARCSVCGSETSLYDSEVPICIQCSDKLHEERKKREQETLADYLRTNQRDNSTEA